MKARDASLPLLALILLGSTWASAAQKPKPRDKGVPVSLAIDADGSRVDQTIARTVGVIQKRCRLLGIHCKFQRKMGEHANRVMLHFSTRRDSDRIKGILVAKGLELRGVISPRFPEQLQDYSTLSQAIVAAGTDNEVFSSPGDGEVRYLIAERVPFFTGNDVKSCVVLRSEENVAEYEVDCLLRPAGAIRLEAWTRANINRYAAIIFNGGVLSAAYIKAPISSNVVVSGGFNKREAQDAVVILHSGNLPAGVELVEDGTGSPKSLVANSRPYVRR